jgi:hypothetical protein
MQFRPKIEFPWMSRAEENAKATVRCQHSRSFSAGPFGQTARAISDQNSGEKSETKPLR